MLRTSYLFYDYFKVDTFFSHAVFFSGATGRHMMSHILFSNFKFDAICVTFLHKSVQNGPVGTYGGVWDMPQPTFCQKTDSDSRALPDITSCPEVWQIFKVRTVRKPEVFPL